MTIRDIIIVAASTLFIYWIIGFVIFWITGENENFAVYWCMGLVYWIVWILCTPYRIVRRYLPTRGRKR